MPLFFIAEGVGQSWRTIGSVYKISQARAFDPNIVNIVFEESGCKENICHFTLK